MTGQTLQSSPASTPPIVPSPTMLDVGGVRCLQCGTPVNRVSESCPGCGAPVEARSPFLESTDPAAPGRRLLATVIDGLVPLAVVVGQLVLPAPSSALRWSLWGVLVAWIGILIVTEGVTGRTPGKALLALRTVDVRSGRVIGLGAAALRTPTKLVESLGTVAVGGLSYRWDPGGQERTWWDRAAGSRVIDASVQIPGGTARTPGLAPGTVDAVAARWAPELDRAGVVTSVPRSGPPGFPPGPAGVPRTPAGPPQRPVGPPPGPVRAQHSPAGAQPSPAASSPAAPGPAAPRPRTAVPLAGLPPVPPVPLADMPPVPPVSSVSSTQRAEAAGDRRPRHAAPDGALPAGGPAPVQPARASTDPVGWGRPGIPPGPPGVVDDPTTETAAAGLQDPTRVHSREELGALPARVPGRPTTATLQWDTGARVVVGGTVLIGRDPVSDDGEKVDRRLAVGRGSVGVSKTHLLLSITTAGVTVTDRHSTNGVRLEHADGTAEKCRPDQATAVRDGDVIRFGGRSITLPSD